MVPLSIIIVCRNEGDIIGRTLQAVTGLSDDIILYDNGSTDDTITIAGQYHVRIIQGTWEGYGKTKKKSVSFAKYDWILSLDADEIVEDTLHRCLNELALQNDKEVYAIRRKNFLGSKHIRYGEWGMDYQNRLFNRRVVNWDESEVHETLLIPLGVAIKKLTGAVLHQTMTDLKDYSEKTIKYAELGALKYFRNGKKSGPFKRWLSPVFTFLKYYIFKLGFLDGAEGFTCAKMGAKYTYLKYSGLRKLELQNHSI